MCIVSSETFAFISDPGHGWLEVPRQLLHDFGIEYDISRFSYVRGRTAYLEEDQDAGVFIEAFKVEKPDVELKFKEIHINVDSEIRNLRSYPMTREAITA